MGDISRPSTELIETGTEPDFFCSVIVRCDTREGNMRIYFASQRGGIRRLELSMIAPINDWVLMAHQIIRHATEAGDGIISGLN